jgi:hypothetical protein
MGVGRPDFSPVRLGEVGEGGDLLGGIAQHLGDLRELDVQGGRDLFDLGAHQRAGGLGEDGAHRGGDHLR